MYLRYLFAYQYQILSFDFLQINQKTALDKPFPRLLYNPHILFQPLVYFPKNFHKPIVLILANGLQGLECVSSFLESSC